MICRAHITLLLFTLENLLDNSLERANSINWDQPRQSAVKFLEGEEEEKTKPVVNTADANFVRHDTPHPKELKARHQKLFAQKEKQSSSENERENEQDNESVQNDTGFNHQREASVSSNSSSDASSVIIKSDSEIAAERHTRFAASEEKVDSSAANVQNATTSSESENDFYTNAENRHVGFSSEVTIDESEEHYRHNTKLHRRDTPHHLKNKRINVQTSKEEQEKVAHILAEAIKKNESQASTASLVSGESESNRPPSSVSNTPTARSNSYEQTIDKVQMEVRVMKTSSGLGLSIAGGQGSTPYKGTDEGIFVSRITSDGPADKAGLQIGDKILAVNNMSMLVIDHYKAVDVLKCAGNSFVLTIVREVPVSNAESPSPKPRTSIQSLSSPKVNGEVSEKLPSPTKTPSVVSAPQTPDFDLKRQIIYTTLIRDQNGLGFSVRGGKDDPQGETPGNSIYISRIADGGAAHRDGKLRVGDKILSINGVDVEGARHDQVVGMLTGLERFVRLVIQREGEAVERTRRYGPEPYTGLYASSYMANRPSYTGSYKRPILGSVSSLVSGDGNSNPVTPTTTTSPRTPPTYSIYTKLPGLRNDPNLVNNAVSPAPNVTSASNAMQAQTSASSSLDKKGSA